MYTYIVELARVVVASAKLNVRIWIVALGAAWAVPMVFTAIVFADFAKVVMIAGRSSDSRAVRLLFDLSCG